MGVASLVFNNVAVAYGAEMIAAFGIAQSVVQLLELVTMGLYEGVVPLIGGAWGADDKRRLWEVVKKTALCLGLFCLVACAPSLVFADQIVSLFTDDPLVAVFGPAILAMQILAVPFASGTGLLLGVLQACGKGAASNVLSMVKGLAFVPCVVLGSMLFGVDGVIASLLVAELLAFCIALALTLWSYRCNESPVAAQA
jgi:Na+-driven multidrug efflux pump